MTFPLRDASLTRPCTATNSSGPALAAQQGINRDVPWGPNLPLNVISVQDDFSINNIVSPSSREFIIAPLQEEPPRTNYLSIRQSCPDARLPVAAAAEAQTPWGWPSSSTSRTLARGMPWLLGGGVWDGFASPL